MSKVFYPRIKSRIGSSRSGLVFPLWTEEEYEAMGFLPSSWSKVERVRMILQTVSMLLYWLFSGTGRWEINLGIVGGRENLKRRDFYLHLDPEENSNHPLNEIIVGIIFFSSFLLMTRRARSWFLEFYYNSRGNRKQKYCRDYKGRPLCEGLRHSQR